MPYYELLYSEEDNTAKTSVKTIVTASFYNFEINVGDLSYSRHFLLILYKLV